VSTHRCTLGEGRYSPPPQAPQANFKTLANKNAIKPQIRGPPMAIFPERLDPPRDFGKNFRYPLPCIFNPCTSTYACHEQFHFQFFMNFPSCYERFALCPLWLCCEHLKSDFHEVWQRISELFLTFSWHDHKYQIYGLVVFTFKF
jgi:hypothetical protein